jgi:ABC-type branched-subunit amino acid transport system substrate-binding protein
VRLTNCAVSEYRLARVALAIAAVVMAATLTSCTSTATTTAVDSSSATRTIPQPAFHDYTGVTPTTVTVGNVSTLTAGLFEGAVVGTKAYAAYVNSQGGIHGRRIIVDSYDDSYTGAGNKQYTQEAVEKDFATVGSFSLQDNFGGAVLAANPQVPNITVSLDPSAVDLPNSFSPDPAVHGWPLGPVHYFNNKFPDAVAHTGSLVADQPSAIGEWNDQRTAMEHVGYHIVYDHQFDLSQTDFDQNVIAMRNAGVKILFIEQMPQNYAAAVIRAMNLQNFHPVLVLGDPTYSEELVPDSGGAAAIDGAYLEQFFALYLGEDADSLPAVHTFLTWVQKVSPDFKPDLFTLFGWLSGQLFGEALSSAGTHPSRGSVLQALGGITSFTGGNLTARTNPAAKTPASCYLIARVVDGRFQRLDDPPVDGPTHGYRCDQPFYYLPS